ncbi:MAG: hypothetical protein CVV59_01025 [Tenericutes bacterium HGW-Tenericutes-4]|nr:MAG: hypothetical protein CVV59_01025 [Tenericutes bacterium HGW-Tenericutes-4]
MKDIKMRTLYKYPFLGSVIAGVPLVEDATRKTAATDGKSVHINPNFFYKLTKDQQVFLYAHEVLHIAFDHISRRKDKKPKLWNIATDAVINELLKKDGLPMIKGGVEMAGASEKTAEMVYAELLKKQREEKKDQEKNQNKDKGKGQDDEQNEQDSQDDDEENEEDDDENVGHDSHDMWKDAIKTEQDVIDAKAMATVVERAIKMAGNSTSSIVKAFALREKQKPVVNWKYLLRQSLKENIDWTYQDAEFENNVLHARLEKLPQNQTEIVIDTSGSISDELIRIFLAEVANMLKFTKMKAGCFDSKFYGFDEITRKNINDFKIIGRGGTDFDVAVNAFSRSKAVNKIIFTDGYASMPENSLKAIWLVVGEEKIEPKGGKVIHITEEQLSKMTLVVEDEKTR